MSGKVSVFFGLGPRGDITESLLRERIEEICPVTEFRMRERFAFADCSQHDAETMVKRLNGVKINSSTLTVQISKRDDPATARRGNDRRGDRRDVRRSDDSGRRDRSRRRDDSRRRDHSRRRDDSRDRRRRDGSRDRRDVRRRDDSRDRRRRDDSRDRRRDDSRDKRRRRDDRDDRRRGGGDERRERGEQPAADAVEPEGVIEETYTSPIADVMASYQQENNVLPPLTGGVDGSPASSHRSN